MGFLDKAKAAATDLAAKADTALSGATGGGGPRPGDADKYFRDLGVLTYLELTGRPADAAERERVLGALRDFDSQGALRAFALQTAPQPVPPAPGMAAQMAPPPAPGMAGATPPPMPGATMPPPMPGAATPPPPMPGAVPAPPAEAAPPAPEAPAAPAAPVTPPPPPSWA